MRGRADVTLGERLQRAASPEGIIAAVLILLWLVPLLFLGGAFFFVLLAIPAMLLLWATLELGSTVLNWFFAVLYGAMATILGATYLLLADSSLGVGLAMFGTLVVFEMLDGHDLRKRNASVDPNLLTRRLVWLAGVGFVSLMLGLPTVDSTVTRVSWLFVPAASLGLFALVVGLTVGPIMIRKGSATGGRWRPTERLPPAPGDVDPLVEEARSATRYARAPVAPPAPTRSSTRFPG